MPRSHRITHDFLQRIQLAGAAIVILQKEGGVASDLPEPREDGQNLDLALPHVPLLEHFVEFLLALEEPGLVDLVLLGGHFADLAALHLVRQLGEHILLQTPQDKGHDVAPEVRGCLLILLLHNGRFITLLELCLGKKITGHQIIKERP